MTAHLPYLFLSKSLSPISFSLQVSLPLSLYTELVSRPLRRGDHPVEGIHHHHLLHHLQRAPPLQINIPREQANSILEMRHTLGPYIFREAQVQSVYLPYML